MKNKGFISTFLDVVSDICDGAKVLDNYVLHKDTRVKFSLEDKSCPDTPMFSFDRTWKNDRSLLQLLVMLLGFAAAIAVLCCMTKIRKAEKKKMKEKIKKVKSEKNMEIKRLKNQAN